MTVKTNEMIHDEINEVKKEFANVEQIIGRVACEGGRHHLVYRELRSFTWFVGMMIFSKVAELSDDFDKSFKKEYDNFCLTGDSDAEDLFEWACLYWIYNKKWEETDEYKELEEMI